MNPQFKIVSQGELLPSYEVLQVKQNLATICKVPVNKLDAWFTGKQVIIKEGIELSVANKYKTAFERAGMICSIESMGEVDKEKPDSYHKEFTKLKKIISEQQKDITILQQELKIQKLEVDNLKHELEEVQQFLLTNSGEHSQQILEKTHIEEAYVALKRIEASVNSGVTYQEYSTIVTNAQLELELIPDELSSGTKEILWIAFQFYQKAKTLWGLRIQDDQDGINEFIVSLGRDEKLQAFLEENDLMPVEEEVHGLLKSIGKGLIAASIAANSDKLQQYFWQEASGCIEIAEKGSDNYE